MGWSEPFLDRPEAALVPLERDALAAACRAGFDACGHGDLPGWLDAIAALPRPANRSWCLTGDAVAIEGTLGPAERDGMRDALRALVPWRKGPFAVCGLQIDTEWRSWMKWNRIAAAVAFTDCRVLDVGSGNGYYGWRLLGAGAASVTGIDPTPVYVAQFHALRRLGGETANWVLPLRAEALTRAAAYDRVLSLGVLYHQRAPIEHLRALRRWCAASGRVVVETLVVPGDADTVLTPRDRYARMRNVWFLPSPAALLRWLERAGFSDARIVDETPTTVIEQRRTEWMPHHSLAEFLDPADPGRTIEGHPGPTRAIAVAVP